MQTVCATCWNPMDASLERHQKDAALQLQVPWLVTWPLWLQSKNLSKTCFGCVRAEQPSWDPGSFSCSEFLKHTLQASAGVISGFATHILCLCWLYPDFPSQLISNTSSSETCPDFQLGTCHSLAGCKAHMTLKQLVWWVCVLIWLFWWTHGNPLEPSTKLVPHEHSVTGIMKTLQSLSTKKTLGSKNSVCSHANNLLARDSAV